MKNIQLNKTNRGFRKITFEDLYDNEGILQDSSLATDDAIWLGTQTKLLVLEDNKGWEEHNIKEILKEKFPDNKGILLQDRLHLNKEYAKTLISYLEYFVEHGVLPNEELSLLPTNLNKELIEKHLELSYTTKPDHDDLIGYYELPNGVELSCSIISFNQPADMDTLYCLDDLFEITTLEELLKVKEMSYEEFITYANSIESDIIIDEWL